MVPIYCSSCWRWGYPAFRSQTSTLGWIVFTVLLLTTCVGAPLGFLFKRHTSHCRHCWAGVA